MDDTNSMSAKCVVRYICSILHITNHSTSHPFSSARTHTISGWRIPIHHVFCHGTDWEKAAHKSGIRRTTILPLWLARKWGSNWGNEGSSEERGEKNREGWSDIKTLYSRVTEFHLSSMDCVWEVIFQPWPSSSMKNVHHSVALLRNLHYPVFLITWSIDSSPSTLLFLFPFWCRLLVYQIIDCSGK